MRRRNGRWLRQPDVASWRTYTPRLITWLVWCIFRMACAVFMIAAPVRRMCRRLMRSRNQNSGGANAGWERKVRKGLPKSSPTAAGAPSRKAVATKAVPARWITSKTCRRISSKWLTGSTRARFTHARLPTPTKVLRSWQRCSGPRPRVARLRYR